MHYFPHIKIKGGSESFPFTFPTFPKLMKPFPVADNSFPGKGKEGKDLWPFLKLMKPFPVAAFPFLSQLQPFLSQLQPFLSQLFLAFPGNYPLGAVHIWRPIFGLAHFLTYLPTPVRLCPNIDFQFDYMVSDFGKSTYLPKSRTSFMDVPIL